MQRVLIVDDDRVTQKALKRLFESEGYIVDVRGDGKAALDTFHSTDPSAVILDLRLPLISGEEVCREIRNQSPRVPIIVLSAVDNVVDKVRLLEIGADDYVTKPFSPRELLARLRAVIRHAIKSDNRDIEGFDGVSVDFAKMNVTLDRHPVQLTALEFKLLKFLLEREQRVVSREEILGGLLGYKVGSYLRSVDNLISQLRQKLERDPTNPVHFRTVRGAGYRFVR
jgi:two-component system, OmpR family, alkaline phosphatase synthesis response regulator PhoP